MASSASSSSSSTTNGPSTKHSINRLLLTTKRRDKEMFKSRSTGGGAPAKENAGRGIADEAKSAEPNNGDAINGEHCAAMATAFFLQQKLLLAAAALAGQAGHSSAATPIHQPPPAMPSPSPLFFAGCRTSSSSASWVPPDSAHHQPPPLLAFPALFAYGGAQPHNANALHHLLHQPNFPQRLGHPRRSLAIFHHWRHTIFSSRSVDKTQLSKPSSLHCFNNTFLPNNCANLWQSIAGGKCFCDTFR
uniref:Uncharacterized protein n=1 Tax=Globodera pallida TaxID=36090 RepID=A0A183CMC6_GLOPA